MFIFTLFTICSLIIIWSLFGYYIFLFLISLFKKKKEKHNSYYPCVTVIIPCYNEAKYIKEKIENLKDQNYPSEKISFIIVDCGSGDETLEYIKKSIADTPNFQLINCPEKGKIHQLNYVLPMIKSKIIISTDVDGIMEKNCIKYLVDEFNRNERIAVVGAYVYPEDSIPIETGYWELQNKGRLIETAAYSSSIVIAGCYAFRKDLLDKFPLDVIADDIYIAYLANTLGYKVVFSKKAIVGERRSPSGSIEFIRHKIRKGNAFFRENLRFIYLIPEMPGFWKIIFITKFIQLTLLPFLQLLWITIALFLTIFGISKFLLLETAGIIIISILTLAIFVKTPLPVENKTYPKIILLKNWVIITFIVLFNVFTYPFINQSSSYKKL
jgi:cellulose synthase/poly-beta-1,6-N-acetylglucosamine synthase-like glycosyltransferase